MKVKYSIYTEDLRRGMVERMISKCFKGFTLIEVTGYWEGKQEKAVKIEIIGHKMDLHLIEKICGDIKQLNQQDAVLFTVDYIDSTMI